MIRARAPELDGRGWIGTGGRALTLADLRGKVVILDFWTLCCVNCLHVIDELRPLEAAYPDELVIVGVHSPKFAYEGEMATVQAAVERYDVRHPVLVDSEHATWRAYGAKAWPTLVVIDPEGFLVAHMAGEGHGPALDAIVRDVVGRAEREGRLRRGLGPWVPPPVAPSDLRFPSKAIWSPTPTDDGGPRLLIADAGHHSLAEMTVDGTLLRRICTGERGLTDGGPGDATMSEPSGLCALPCEIAAEVGYDIVVADTVNHALRGVRLSDGQVATVAGTGHPAGPDDQAPWFEDRGVVGLAANGTRLSSPWDVVWDAGRDAVVVAMAGIHQLWAFDPVSGRIGVLAGTRGEGLADGDAREAWLAQPSGLAVGEDGRVWIADSETSALRALEPDGQVRTYVGQGLFDFGHVDGRGALALLQHPLGVAMTPDGDVAIADTYNGAVRIYRVDRDEVETLAEGLTEPADLLILPEAAGGDGSSVSGGALSGSAAPNYRLLVVESGAHRISEIATPAQALDKGRLATDRPPLEVRAGEVELLVPFSPAPGHRLDDRAGPATRLSVSATPPSLLISGAGEGETLSRTLVLAEGEGVLHVTARAAACDAEAEHPACHLVTQDWGVPLKITPRPAAAQ
ncbi:MAG: redoxin domain-containing protein, partial [Micrococcales bacterium]|nr:redoxin domain-containing protein [Micrococcales bacterium]